MRKTDYSEIEFLKLLFLLTVPSGTLLKSIYHKK